MRFGPSIEVPSNASRFLGSRELALRQSVSRIELAWRVEDPYLYNDAFDPSAIAHDQAYCTSVVDLDGVVQVPTTGFFMERVLPHAPPSPIVVDIGCGQGELVRWLRAQEIDASGYDPVLREPDDHLHDRYWTALEPAADVYVMRCVLPHIHDPWSFLRDLGDVAPQALVLVEFQRLEWILDQSIWFQICHDHVNLFSTPDFESRFAVLDQGTFSNGEWAWVLIRAGSLREPAPREMPYAVRLDDLFAERSRVLSAASERSGPLAIWGAAGKGIVLAHALVGAGAEVVAAVDADRVRHDLYLEVSGVEILSPERAAATLPSETLVVVCNPNHLSAVRERVQGTWDVVLPLDFGRPPADPGDDRRRETGPPSHDKVH
jgi:methyltransferase family protein